MLKCEIRSRRQEIETTDQFRFVCFGAQNQSRHQKGPLSEEVHRGRTNGPLMLISVDLIFLSIDNYNREV